MLWGRHPLRTDAVVAALLGAMGTLRVLGQYRINQQAGVPIATDRLTAIVLVWCCAAPLALRRGAPEVSFVACIGVFIATRLVEVPEPTVTVVVLATSFVSIGVHGSPRWRTAIRLAGAIALAVMYVVVAVRTARRADLGGAFNVILGFDAALSVLIIVTAWTLGEVWRSRTEHANDLAERTAELDEERHANAERAVIEERLRIARELHDVLAHHVSLMGVQAAAAGRVIGRDPQRARASLDVIETSSRDAVDEFRRLVGFLRAGSHADEAGPQPGLGRGQELIADARRSGLDVGWRVLGDPVALPPGVDLSAFRIVQEALTNTRKHADARRAEVTIDFQPTRLDVTVTDDGMARPTSEQGGLGLLGMRERLRLHEGRLEAGPRPEGGYRVHAEFPLRGHR